MKSGRRRSQTSGWRCVIRLQVPPTVRNPALAWVLTPPAAMALPALLYAIFYGVFA